jgi:hypothetical protein
LAEGFQRRRLKCEKLTDDGRQVMAKAHIAFGYIRYIMATSFSGEGSRRGPRASNW